VRQVAPTTRGNHSATPESHSTVRQNHSTAPENRSQARFSVRNTPKMAKTGSFTIPAASAGQKETFHPNS
jgi:hypothetical protein